MKVRHPLKKGAFSLPFFVKKLILLPCDNLLSVVKWKSNIFQKNC